MGDLNHLTTTDSEMHFMKGFSPFDRIMELVQAHLGFPSGSGTVKVTVTSPKGQELVALSLPSSYFAKPKSRVDFFVPAFSLDKQRLLLEYPELTMKGSLMADAPTKEVRRFEVRLLNNRATDDPYVTIRRTDGGFVLEGTPVNFKYGEPAEGMYPLEAFHTTDFKAKVDLVPVLESPRMLRPFFQYDVIDAVKEADTLRLTIKGPAAHFFQRSGQKWIPTEKQDITEEGFDVGEARIYSLPLFERDIVDCEVFEPPVNHTANPFSFPVVWSLEHNGKVVGVVPPIGVRYPIYVNGTRVHLDVETVRRALIATALVEQQLFSDQAHRVGSPIAVKEATPSGTGVVLHLPLRLRKADVYEASISDYSQVLDPLTLVGKWLKKLEVSSEELLAVCDQTVVSDFSVRSVKKPLVFQSDAYGYSNVVSMSVLLSYVVKLATKEVGQATLCTTLNALISITLNSEQWKEVRLGQTARGYKVIPGGVAYEMEELDKGVDLVTGIYPPNTLVLVRETSAAGARVFVCRIVDAAGENAPLQIVYDPYFPSAVAGSVLTAAPGCEYSIRALKGYTAQEKVVNGKATLALSSYGNENKVVEYDA